MLLKAKIGVILLACLAALLLAACGDSSPTSGPAAQITLPAATATPTSLPPTATALPVLPTATPPPSLPTATPFPPTATPVPSTATLLPPTATLLPPTATPVVTSPPATTAAATPTAPALPGDIEIPAAGDQVTVPLHILAHLGKPGDQVNVTLRWQNGIQLKGAYTVLKDAQGQGLLVANLYWGPIPQPPNQETQPATLEIRDQSGQSLAHQNVTVLKNGDPATQEIKLFWVVNEDVQPMSTFVPRTQQIGTAALNELLWGPPAPTNIGFYSELPAPQEVLAWPGRQDDWSNRVTLRKLTITDGVATADFSRELLAYGGGSLRVKLISDQITQTLKQFPTVKEVRILIEGQPNMLQP